MLFCHLWSVIFFKFTEFLIMLKLLRKNSHLLHAVHLNFKTILAVFDQLEKNNNVNDFTHLFLFIQSAFQLKQFVLVFEKCKRICHSSPSRCRFVYFLLVCNPGNIRRQEQEDYQP